MTVKFSNLAILFNLKSFLQLYIFLEIIIFVLCHFARKQLWIKGEGGAKILPFPLPSVFFYSLWFSVKAVNNNNNQWKEEEEGGLGNRSKNGEQQTNMGRAERGGEAENKSLNLTEKGSSGKGEGPTKTLMWIVRAKLEEKGAYQWGEAETDTLKDNATGT